MQHCIIHCTWSTDNNAVCRKFRWQATNAFYRVLNAVFISHAILTFLKRVTVRRTNQCWFLTENERCYWRGFADSVGRKRHDEHSIISGFSSSSSSSCRRNKLREYKSADCFVQDLRLRPVNWLSIIHTEFVRTVTTSTSGGSRIFARGVRQLVPLECPKPLHALSPSDR